ncbi:cell wall-binding repeat-containing protein [soil metagenome]
MPRPRLLIVVLLAGLVAVGCGRTEPIGEEPDQPALLTPQRQSFENLGFPEFATKNTTRVAGTNATRTAAAVVRAVFPDRARKPAAITLVDTSDWRVAVAAAALMAAPIKAPVLYSDGNELPAASRRAIDVLEPAGSKAAGNAEIIRVGDVAKPSGYKSTDLEGATPLALTRSIAGLIISAKTRTAPSVIVTSADDPSYAAPAAGYAAKTGDPILFVNKNKIPPETRAALANLARPRIYLLGPSKIISPEVSRQLRRLGAVKRVGGQDPVRNAIEFARYFDGDFGWAVSTPGHGMVFARAGRPLDAAAAAPLSGAGSYGPLFLLDDADRLDESLQGQLLDTQPAYRTNPVAGVYNHGWIIGDRKAITISTQAKLDSLLEIGPERTPDNPPDQPAPSDRPAPDDEPDRP